MGLKDCRITLDNLQNTYYPGQTLNGYVDYTFDAVKKVRGIKVEFTGLAATSWDTSEERTNADGKKETITIKNSAKEEYFTISSYLLGSKSGNEIQIPAGTHRYPFTCALPSTIPSSFEGEYGFVRYSIKLTLDRPWKFDQESIMDFFVIGMLDLNLDRKYKAPLNVHIDKTYCCWCCKSGMVNLDITAPVSGFCPEEDIPLNISCENGSNVDIECVKIKLHKICIYHCEIPGRDTRESDIKLVSLTTEMFPANSTKNIVANVKIPPLPPTNLDNCGIIDIKYTLSFEMCPKGPRFNSKVTTAITIGTIPFGAVSHGDQRNVHNPSVVITDQTPLLASAPMETPAFNPNPPTYQIPGANNGAYSPQTSPYAAPPVSMPSPNVAYPLPAPVNTPYPAPANSPYPTPGVAPYPAPGNASYPPAIGINPYSASANTPYPAPGNTYPAPGNTYPAPGNTPYPAPAHVPYPAPANLPYPPAGGYPTTG